MFAAQPMLSALPSLFVAQWAFRHLGKNIISHIVSPIPRLWSSVVCVWRPSQSPYPLQLLCDIMRERVVVPNITKGLKDLELK